MSTVSRLTGPVGMRGGVSGHLLTAACSSPAVHPPNDMPTRKAPMSQATPRSQLAPLIAAPDCASPAGGRGGAADERANGDGDAGSRRRSSQGQAWRWQRHRAQSLPHPNAGDRGGLRRATRGGVERELQLGDRVRERGRVVVEQSRREEALGKLARDDTVGMIG